MIILRVLCEFHSVALENFSWLRADKAQVVHIIFHLVSCISQIGERVDDNTSDDRHHDDDHQDVVRDVEQIFAWRVIFVERWRVLQTKVNVLPKRSTQAIPAEVGP